MLLLNCNDVWHVIHISMNASLTFLILMDTSFQLLLLSSIKNTERLRGDASALHQGVIQWLNGADVGCWLADTMGVNFCHSS